MKNDLFLIRSCAICLLSTLLTLKGFGQAPKMPTSRLINEIASVRQLKDTAGKLLPDRLFTIKLDSALNSVSGIAYKEGKAAFSSATVDDDGITVNLNLVDNEHLTWQFTASGTSKKGTVDVFSSGKYNKTLGAGFNFIYFPFTNSAGFLPAEKDRLNKQLDQISGYYDYLRSQTINEQEIDQLKTIYENWGGNIYAQSAFAKNAGAGYDQDKKTFQQLLKKYAAYLPSDFESLDHNAQISAIKQLADNKADIVSNYLYQQQLDSLTAVQLKAKYNKTALNWHTLNVKYNNTKYPLYDASADKTLYTSSFNDGYFSLAYSLNLLWIHPKATFWLFPTIKYQNSRDFDEDNLVSVDVPQGTKTIGGQTVNEYKQTAYYNSIATVNPVWTAELPFVIFFPKSSLGLDLGVLANVAPKFEKLGGRLGLYIPLSTAKEKIIIEPVININKLEQHNLSFFKEQLSFGINLTVTLPEFITGKE
jgi:hypothetical protein